MRGFKMTPLFNTSDLSYPEGNFGQNQLLGGSMSLSPLVSHMTSNLHVSRAFQPPPQFPMASLFGREDHHLSGPSIHSYTQTALNQTALLVPTATSLNCVVKLVSESPTWKPSHVHYFHYVSTFKVVNGIDTLLCTEDSLDRVTRRVVNGAFTYQSSKWLLSQWRHYLGYQLTCTLKSKTHVVLLCEICGIK